MAAPLAAVGAGRGGAWCGARAALRKPGRRARVPLVAEAAAPAGGAGGARGPGRSGGRDGGTVRNSVSSGGPAWSLRRRREPVVGPRRAGRESGLGVRREGTGEGLGARRGL